MLRFRSNGKLLISGEYLVLVGAKAFAVPTKFGQSLEIEENHSLPSHRLRWTSYDHKNIAWFSASYDITDFAIVVSNDKDVAERLQKMLQSCRDLNPAFLQDSVSLEAKSYLEFPRNWGLGSSSTLTNNLAQWAKIDALKLHFSFSHGSGYDVAAAAHDTPILYQLNKGNAEVIERDFDPSFADELHFVHLNQKQDSAVAVKDFLSQLHPQDTDLHCHNIGITTEAITRFERLSTFSDLLEQHEEMMSKILNTPTIKQQLFPDYPKTIKSLGAWGGDFVLAIGTADEMQYFKEKGYNTVIPYNDMVINNSHQ